jgi:hypothetical protein
MASVLKGQIPTKIDIADGTYFASLLMKRSPVQNGRPYQLFKMDKPLVFLMGRGIRFGYSFRGQQ